MLYGMKTPVTYLVSEQSDSIVAYHNGCQIGEISYVRVGIDKMIIDYTDVHPDYRNQDIGLSLVRSVANLARSQHRRVISLCPFARAMFNRYPEFDDIRLMNVH